jgi:deazaflavin-dependent oxidoreductase (nitroreductase family)
LWGKTYHFGDDNKTVTRYPVSSSFGKLAVKEINMVAQASDAKTVCNDHAIRAFPLPGTTLHDVILKPEFRQGFHSKLKLTNRLLVPLYKAQMLSLFGLDKRIMLLRTKGRNSQTMRDFPIGYFRIENALYVFSAWGKQSNWYKNLIACPEQVYAQIGLRRFRVQPQVVKDPQELMRVIQQLVLNDPDGARTLMGWNPGRDNLETADFSLMIEKVLTVKFRERVEPFQS